MGKPRRIRQLKFDFMKDIYQYYTEMSNTLEEKVNREKSFYDGKYHGYSIKLEVVRKGLEYEPVYIEKTEDVYNFLRYLENQDKERFLSILLDLQGRVVGVD